jgi:hypothetical protein
MIGCAGSGAGGKAVSVGGTYQTTVTLIESTCPDMGVQQHPTVVTHQPGDSVFTITHAGASYEGVLQPNGLFRTRPTTFTITNVTYGITLVGTFSADAVDIRADVQAGRQPPCHLAARWSGPKDGPPNVLP